jgi:crotonobetainyl-CoA:carnitine CoA-transferase CaiB-like acyl-CoA transferase
MSPEPFHPLRDIGVLDLTSSLAGPYCTEILAALGGEVVKIEHPKRGDETRQWGPPFWDGEGAIFLAANAGKRSLALDFHDDQGKEALLRLADKADVVVQSLRPGHAERIGLGPDDLRGRNARLVYCSIGAYGRAGSRREQPGYDPLMQAAGESSASPASRAARASASASRRSTRAQACGRRSEFSAPFGSATEPARAGSWTSPSTKR